MNQKDKQEHPMFLLLILPLVCCGAIILLALGGTGIFGGILSGQWLLIAIGLLIVILGLYFYFKKK